MKSITHSIENDGAKIVVRPPILLVFFILIGVLVNMRVPWEFLIERSMRLFPGFVLLAGSVGLAAWSLTIFFRAGQNPDPVAPTESLYANGPYSRSRNPMYVALFVFQFSLALLLDNAWIAVTVPATFLSIHFGVVLREETYLQDKFGASYIDYCTRVRRYL